MTTFATATMDGMSSAETHAVGVNGGAATRLRFEALYFEQRLSPINPEGDVGVVTLWSPVRAARRKLEAISPPLLDPAKSRIAVIANLYGDGMYAMFCNLLYNPQVRHLIAIGEDLGLPTAGELDAFLQDGLEAATMLGTEVTRVRGTQRVLPTGPGFDDERLRTSLSFHALGKLSRPGLGEDLLRLLDELPDHRDAAQPERLRVDVAGHSHDYAYKPSDVGAHQVVRRRPLDCWQELVVRVMRFGRPVALSDGPRLELLNAKAVITEPVEEPEQALQSFGFDLTALTRYQRQILRPELPEGIDYTYGNRLRGYFEDTTGSADTLDTVIEALRHDQNTRRAYMTLWDNTADLDGDGSAPCLTTLFFRTSEDRLTLTATYRAHNLLSAWLMNVYGLIAIQRHVASAVGMAPGPVTVVSHSIGIDPRSPRFALGQAIAEGWKTDDDLDRQTGKYTLREDPNGYFVVSSDAERGVVVAEHRFGGALVKRYEAERALTIEREVAADMAISLPSHAMWLGRELTLSERALRRDRT